MALNPEEMNRRHERREEQRRMQQVQTRRMRRQIILAVVLLAVTVGAIFYIARGARQAAAEVAAVTDAGETESSAETEGTETTAAAKNADTVIHLRAAGDLNVTNATVQSGLAVSGYDFTDAFMDVAAELACGDITVLNLEGNVCGEPYGDGTASAPDSLLTALKNAGVDLVQVANSYAVNNGIIGLTTTLNRIRAAGIEPLGAYATNEEFEQSKGYTMVEVQGIKIAFVAFTKGLGGMSLPAGSESCVNLLYTDYDSSYKTIDTEGINRVLDAAAAEEPDIIVAMLHWGSENSDTIANTQEKIVTLLQKKGVDIIIGSHPHLLQKITYDTTAGTLVAYSLGDFFGSATHDGTNYSIILDVEITKNAETDETTVTGFSYVPIYIAKDTELVSIRQEGARRVLRIRDAMSAYSDSYVDSITASCYASMQNSLTRIEARIQGKASVSEG